MTDGWRQDGKGAGGSRPGRFGRRVAYAAAGLLGAVAAVLALL